MPGKTRPPRNARRYSKSSRSRRFRRGDSKRQRIPPPKARFEGATSELNNHFFDINYNQSEQYNKTIKAVYEYVWISYNNGADARVSIKELIQVEIIILDKPQNVNALEKRI